MKDLNAILIGAGTMGKRHKSRLERLGVRFVDVVDVAESAAFPACLDQRLEAPDFVVVASPAQTHYGYVKNCLERKIPVLVEKPLAVDAFQAQELVDLARANGTVLLVAQSECFNPLFLNFRKHFMKELDDRCGTGAAVQPCPADALCKPGANRNRNERPCENVRLEFRREHGFTERCRDVDVSLDILVHDLSMFLTLFKFEDLEILEYRQMNGGDAACMVLEVVRGPYAGLQAFFHVDRNSRSDVRTITAEFERHGVSPASSYSVSLVHYTKAGEVAHIPDSLDNEHHFFLKLLAGACDDWGRRAAQSAADIIKLLNK